MALFVTTRDVEAGEELLWNYGRDFLGDLPWFDDCPCKPCRLALGEYTEPVPVTLEPSVVEDSGLISLSQSQRAQQAFGLDGLLSICGNSVSLYMESITSSRQLSAKMSLAGAEYAVRLSSDKNDRIELEELQESYDHKLKHVFEGQDVEVPKPHLLLRLLTQQKPFFPFVLVYEDSENPNVHHAMAVGTKSITSLGIMCLIYQDGRWSYATTNNKRPLSKPVASYQHQSRSQVLRNVEEILQILNQV